VIRRALKSSARAYVRSGRPLLPLTRWVRRPLRWYFHRSRVLRHDLHGGWGARLLPHLHHVLVGTLPPELTVYGGRIAVRSSRSMIAVHAYYVGEYELHLSRFLAAQVRPGLVMFDVGAHHGVHSLVVAAELSARGLAGHVNAFEPDPENARLLAENLARNGLEAFVTVRPVAVADRDGTDVLLVCVDDNSSNTLRDHERFSLAADQERREHPVALIRLDSLLAEVPRVDLLKLDVQGAEARVLHGAAGLLARDRPVVVVEAVSGWPSTDEVRAFLESHGYSIFGLDREGRPCPVGSREAFVSWDWVALPS
jgi:FkbM family methyltransferase